MIKNEKGITLIILALTIVLILILATATINMSIGQGGMLIQSKETQNLYENHVKTEDNEVNNLLTILEGENKLTPADKGKLITGKNKPYEDEDGKTAIIPAGFCVVTDSEADPNTVERGLVISDVAEDDLENSKHGNQFVWIPVEDYSKFHLIEGYYNGSLDTMLSQFPNPSRESGAEATAGTPLEKNSTAGSSESIAMYSSVQINKGFYIGRFEAGIAGTTDNNSLSTKPVADGTVKPLVQKGVGVWNSISWGGTSSDTSTSDPLLEDDTTPGAGDDTAPGAVVVARSLYPESDKTHNVTSTLCYGVQWDAALNFIDPNYEKAEGNLTSFVANSENKGNYEGSIAVTGSKPSYQQKHIYDLAGNVYEWTMEAYGTFYRVSRGGVYDGTGSDFPASIRGGGNPDGASSGIRPSPSFIFVTLTGQFKSNCVNSNVIHS